MDNNWLNIYHGTWKIVTTQSSNFLSRQDLYSYEHQIKRIEIHSNPFLDEIYVHWYCVERKYLNLKLGDWKAKISISHPNDQ